VTGIYEAVTGSLNGGPAFTLNKPTNDDIASATVLTYANIGSPWVTFWKPITFYGATAEASETAPTYPGDSSVWFKWTATNSGQVATFAGPDWFDYEERQSMPQAQVYIRVQNSGVITGDDSNLVVDSDGGNGAHGTCAWTAVAGTTYWIRVAKYVGQEPNARMRLWLSG
jgi:hypothetical protein